MVYDPLAGDDQTSDELANQEDANLRQHGLDPDELTDDEREDIIGDINDNNDQLDEDAEHLSDVTTPEETDDND
jgi:hypothetical protein